MLGIRLICTARPSITCRKPSFTQCCGQKTPRLSSISPMSHRLIVSAMTGKLFPLTGPGGPNSLLQPYHFSSTSVPTCFPGEIASRERFPAADCCAITVRAGRLTPEQPAQTDRELPTAARARSSHSSRPSSAEYRGHTVTRETFLTRGH